MQIDTLKTFKEVIQAGKTSDLKILFWEAENRQKVSTPAEPRIEINRIFLILGPEGGFTDAEIKLAREADFITMGLGPRILRSETAAIAASTLIQYRYGDMG